MTKELARIHETFRLAHYRHSAWVHADLFADYVRVHPHMLDMTDLVEEAEAREWQFARIFLEHVKIEHVPNENGAPG